MCRCSAHNVHIMFICAFANVFGPYSLLYVHICKWTTGVSFSSQVSADHSETARLVFLPLFAWKWHLAPRLTVRKDTWICWVRAFLLKLVGSCEGWWTFGPGQGSSRVQRFCELKKLVTRCRKLGGTLVATIYATIEVQRSYVFPVCVNLYLVNSNQGVWLIT